LSFIQDIPLLGPIGKVRHPLFERQALQVDILRNDLCHPSINGNKWLKLRLNLQHAISIGADTIVSFGGAYSNHIHALAAAGHCFGLKTVGIIRGEYDPQNPTLQQAKAWGMHLHFVSRSDYRQRYQPEYIAQWQQRYANSYVVPEGGSNALAVKSVAQAFASLTQHYDRIVVAAGTGATAAGIALGAVDHAAHLDVVSVLKGNQQLCNDIIGYIDGQCAINWKLIEDAHWGGYAKTPPELIRQLRLFEAQTAIPLEPVYTAKMVSYSLNQAQKASWSSGERVLLVHTGGLQGYMGFRQRGILPR
tara:strand:+ start:1168 stop:2082 length:915 start_codon:yes stop_codon:yes gene_type:complete